MEDCISKQAQIYLRGTAKDACAFPETILHTNREYLSSPTCSSPSKGKSLKYRVMSSSDCLWTALSNSVDMISMSFVFALASMTVGYSGFDADGFQPSRWNDSEGKCRDRHAS